MVALYATLALRGDTVTQRLLLLNVQRYVQPDAVAVHVSLKSSLQAVEDVSAAACRECLLINPVQYEVAAGSARILGVHLSNVQLLDSRRNLRDDDNIVFVAANNAFFRPCRAHILCSRRCRSRKAAPSRRTVPFLRTVC